MGDKGLLRRGGFFSLVSTLDGEPLPKSTQFQVRDAIPNMTSVFDFTPWATSGPAAGLICTVSQAIWLGFFTAYNCI
jgi:hypothetical protein